MKSSQHHVLYSKLSQCLVAMLGCTLGGIALAAQPGVLGSASGAGPWPAVAELRADLPMHTIYRPQALPKLPLPVLLWGNGACRDNGLAYGAFLRQIASHGYFVVSVGRPREERPFNPNPAPEPAAVAPGQPPPRNTPDETQAAQLLEGLDWATRENLREASPFKGLIDVSRVAVGGHSCGGLQALAISHDPRIDTTLVLASGIYVRAAGARSGVQIDKSQLDKLHAPALYLTGGVSDIAHPNATDDVQRLNHIPVFFGAIPVGHGGTFWTQPDGGEWARVSIRWLDWHLKQDADASWDFAGSGCRLCTDQRWTVTRKQMPHPMGPFRQSLYVPARDGTRLAMHVYRPATDGVPVNTPSPVVFSFTPYRARFRNADGQVIELDQMRRGNHHKLLDHGYVLAVADTRGKGASFGARRGFQDRTEAQDGHDLVQWLAAQPWSNGRVGMYGCSYLGGSSLHVATTAPPALKAIFSAASDLDKFNFVRSGGITAQFNTRPDEPLTDDLMSLPVDEDRDGSLLRAAVAEHARNTPMAALWYGMPFRDSVSSLTGNRYWEEASPYTYLQTLQRSGIATYFWSNWEDEPTAQVIQAAESLNSPLLIGPGSHCVPPTGIDFFGEVRRYFDEHLKSARSSLVKPPRVTWWLEGAGWQHSDSIPGQGVSPKIWRLTKNTTDEGQLLAQAPRAKPRSAAGESSFIVDYAVGDAPYFAFWVDSQHGRGASFTSEPLTAAGTLAGFPVVKLRVASDRSEPLLFAYLEQLSAAGAVKVISFGRLAASYRKTGQAPYNALGLPWHTGLAADHAPLKAGEFVDLEFALTPTARIIPAGDRLRLVITGADPRQRNLQQIKLDPPPQIRIQLDGQNGSSLALPWALKDQ